MDNAQETRCGVVWAFGGDRQMPPTQYDAVALQGSIGGQPRARPDASRRLGLQGYRWDLSRDRPTGSGLRVAEESRQGLLQWFRLLQRPCALNHMAASTSRGPAMDRVFCNPRFSLQEAADREDMAPFCPLQPSRQTNRGPASDEGPDCEGERNTTSNTLQSPRRPRLTDRGGPPAPQPPNPACRETPRPIVCTCMYEAHTWEPRNRVSRWPAAGQSQAPLRALYA
ncbi:hypothetical protein BT67DRAFT_184186 [Trichocladium antarcticum]|uniref:Uncharacterized protein n=1 Tax=Trichocladium antarcticum TaxID=1450529 RepID=A0AAN6URH7_9PEZI|nr:hypothetical protein BT67DRAFT_184186 [Trichocladium antarcticum]